jgi:hypothetical protein
MIDVGSKVSAMRPERSVTDQPGPHSTITTTTVAYFSTSARGRISESVDTQAKSYGVWFMS